jgi:hypothetical protein
MVLFVVLQIKYEDWSIDLVKVIYYSDIKLFHIIKVATSMVRAGIV